MAFKLAKRVSDVTEEYIHQSLCHHYPHIESSKFSKRLIKRLHADFQKKAIENRWFFGDKLRRTIEIPPEKLVQKLRENNPKADKFFTALENNGFSLPPILVVSGKCLKGKQTYKFSKAVAEIKAKDDLITRMRTDGIKFQGIVDHQAKSVKGKSLPNNTESLTADMAIQRLTSGSNYKVIDVINDIIFIMETDTSYIIPYPLSKISYKLKNSALDYDINEAMEAIRASSVTISQDINDFITASSGGFKSCYSIGSCYHFGWQQMWRTPFVWIAFTETKLFHKTGRMWVFNNLTNLGEPITNAPALRFQKAYGDIKRTQKYELKDFILEEYNKAFPKKKRKLERESNELSSKFISTNILGGFGRHAGYFDTGSGITWYETVNPFYHQPKRGKCLFRFADALDLKGEVTTNSNWSDTASNSGVVGVYEDSIMVTSVLSDKTVDSSAAIQLSDGTWVSREDIEAILMTKPEPEPAAETVRPDVETEEVSIEITDEELIDF